MIKLTAWKEIPTVSSSAACVLCTYMSQNSVVDNLQVFHRKSSSISICMCTKSNLEVLPYALNKLLLYKLFLKSLENKQVFKGIFSELMLMLLKKIFDRNYYCIV